MPDRCEVLPGDSVVARRGGGLLWVDAPGSPALVAALHACLGVSGPGADRVLSAVAGEVGRLGTSGASFALVLADTDGGTGVGVALWSGKGQPAVDGVPVSGSSVDGCTLASGFSLGQSLYVGPGQPAAAASSAVVVPPATSMPSGESFTAGSDAGFGNSGRMAAQPTTQGGEQTA